MSGGGLFFQWLFDVLQPNPTQLKRHFFSNTQQYRNKGQKIGLFKYNVTVLYVLVLIG